MAAAGAILVRTLSLLQAKLRPGVTTGELDAAAEKFIRSQGAEPAFKGYRGFPGSICTSPNSMVVHGIPGPYQLSRGDILSVDVGRRLRRLGGRCRPHVPRRRGVADRRPAADRRPSRPCTPPSSSAGPATAWATSPTPSSRWWRSGGMSVVRSLVGHGIGRDMHEDPQIPNYGDPGSGPGAGGGDGAGGGADGHRRAATPCAWATITGRSTPRTALWPPTSSSRSPSRPPGPGSSPPGTWTPARRRLKGRAGCPGHGPEPEAVTRPGAAAL